MLLTTAEGRHWRYEVCEHADGYLVQMRDLETGGLEDAFATVFRTLPVACAYAAMSAAFDQYAAAELEDVADAEIALELESSERAFVDLSDRLHDVGLAGSALKAWDGRGDRAPGAVLH